MLDIAIIATEIALVATFTYRFTTGIVKLWKQCKPAQPISATPQPEVKMEPAQEVAEMPQVSDPWEGEDEHKSAIATSKLGERYFSPVLALPPAKVLPQTKAPKKLRKKTTKPKPQPISVGAAAVDYAKMTSEQLRKECTLQGVNWRTGRDYGKAMKKGQMLIALK